MESYNRRDTRAAWLMLTPFLLFFALFVVYPLAMTIYYSFTNYNWACVPLNVDQDYRLVTDEYLAICEEYTRWRTPFYPNLTVGWDNNIRFREFVPGVMRNNTPEAFEAACERIRQLADRQLAEGKTAAPLITVNSWNEWTETSYLEPDDLYGYGYLEALKKVFDNND